MKRKDFYNKLFIKTEIDKLEKVVDLNKHLGEVLLFVRCYRSIFETDSPNYHYCIWMGRINTMQSSNISSTSNNFYGYNIDYSNHIYVVRNSSMINILNNSKDRNLFSFRETSWCNAQDFICIPTSHMLAYYNFCIAVLKS